MRLRRQALHDARLDLSAAREKLAKQSRFITEVCHDLRQPVHAIGLFIGALRDRELDPESHRLVERLARATLGLDELFHRLLDIGRLDAGAVTPRISAFPIAPLLQTLSDRFSATARERSLEWRLRITHETWVRSDPVLLAELLMNVLSNATRYTKTGGILLAVRRRSGRAVVEVWDTGPGIAAHELDHVFDEFVRLQSRESSRHRAGLGLGLAIVRRLASVLDCQVRVRSRPGRGSVFSISVPMTDPPETQLRQPLPPPVDALRGALMLVVDDDADSLAAMHAVLQGWGCFVLLARSIAEAVREVDQSPRFPDAIVTDHRLAEGSTSRSVVAAVAAGLPQPIPVIVVSADNEDELRREVEEAGWTFIAKPVEAAQLRSVLEARIVGSRKAA